MTAGSVVDQLAEEYADQPVVFLEYDVDYPLGDRVSRWWAAYGGSGTVYLPLISVDSGHLISNSYVDYYNVYKGMVEAELARPALMDIEAYAWREGDKIKFSVLATNNSGVTLSSSNYATIHGIVYEDNHIGVTNRYVRSAVYQPISEALPPGLTATYNFATPDLTGVDWEKLHSLVAVDYIPDTSSSKYDMLQADYASPPDFTASPGQLVFLIDPADPPSDPVTYSISLNGAPCLDWEMSEAILWLSGSPTSGSLSAEREVQVSVDVSKLSPGRQSGVITISADCDQGLSYIAEIPVEAIYGTVMPLFLPVVTR